MNLASIRLIVTDVRRAVEFYELVTGFDARWATDQFAELVTPGCTLAIAGVPTLALFGDNIAEPASNRSAIVEFLVDDVDANFDRMRDAVSDVVQVPTTMPWGNRSMLLRDPDGTLVNLFTPVGDDARTRFGAPSAG